ncbi:MAG TPA: maleylpyruvate isomerase N-terminal domain-containing protein [Thermomicrobiales bacterium]|nr:maleylpyruvate isomerase N-terminal domain-containing protein [Thermomicrobiales bacterium]
MAAPTTKQRFLDAVRQAWAEWAALLARVEPARLDEPGVAGDWSVKDLVAHVAWYEREMVGLARGRALAGSPLWEVEQDRRNALLRDEQRDRAPDAVLAEAREIHRQALAALDTLADDDLADPRRFAGMPADWAPWRVIADNTYEHYRAHMPALRAWLDRAGGRS